MIATFPSDIDLNSYHDTPRYPLGGLFVTPKGDRAFRYVKNVHATGTVNPGFMAGYQQWSARKKGEVVPIGAADNYSHAGLATATPLPATPTVAIPAGKYGFIQVKGRTLVQGDGLARGNGNGERYHNPALNMIVPTTAAQRIEAQYDGTTRGAGAAGRFVSRLWLEGPG